jgi:hypothetical protein
MVQAPEDLERDQRSEPGAPADGDRTRSRAMTVFSSVAACVIIAVGVGFFAVRVESGYRSVRVLTDTPERVRASWFYDWDRCLERTLAAQVPEGSTVYLDTRQQYWTQGLESFATPRLNVVARRADAQYVLKVADATPSTPPARRCGKPVAPSKHPPAFPVGAAITLVVKPVR